MKLLLNLEVLARFGCCHFVHVTLAGCGCPLPYIEGAARTVGEDVETIWAGTNPLAPSICEMGPAAQHNTLNDHWNGWNFHKVVQFCMFLFLFSYFVYHILVNISSHIASKTLQQSNRDEHQASQHIQPVIHNVFHGNYQQMGNISGKLECRSQGPKSLSGAKKL